MERCMSGIFIVEDDVNIREIERYALSNSGYQVEEFGSGTELFMRLQEKLPALILLDIMLPDEYGMDILKKSEVIVKPLKFRLLWLRQNLLKLIK